MLPSKFSSLVSLKKVNRLLKYPTVLSSLYCLSTTSQYSGRYCGGVVSAAAMMMTMSTTTTTTNNTNQKTKKKPIVAIGQLTSTSCKLTNLLNIATCAKSAKVDGACMLFLPECFGFIGENSQQTLDNAEPKPIPAVPIVENNSNDNKDNNGSTLLSAAIVNEQSITDALIQRIRGDDNDDNGQKVQVNNNNVVSDVDETKTISLLDGLQTIAKESNLWISGGGIHILADNDDSDDDSTIQKVYNTHVIVDNLGSIQCLYNKIHLFDVSIPGKVELYESKTTKPGTKLVICNNSPIGIPLGLSTCYDLRFPEIYTKLVQKNGGGNAQILLVPSAFTVPTGIAHWHTLLQGKWGGG